MSTAALTASTSFETGEGAGAAGTPAPAPLPNPAPAAAPTEAYRGFSIASFVIAGCGVQGYELAVRRVAALLAG